MVDVEKITVLGAGAMGRGISQVAAAGGITVKLIDIKEDLVDKAINAIAGSLQRAVEREKITTDEKDIILSRITGTADLREGAGDVKFVIEAATENMDIKKGIFKELEAICSPEAILATNTSALSIAGIASGLNHPERVIGIHFFNPVPVVNLVELIKGVWTSDEVFTVAKELVKKLGKTPVEVRDSPGFIVNRMLVPMINEAAFILMEGIASKEDIDQAMKLGANHPLGPLALGDLVGLDVCLEILKTLYKEFADPKYRPCPILTKMVRGGLLGKKSGIGFYDYRSK